MDAILLVSGDFTPWGGMDHANYELARYLADRGHQVHLVGHTVAPPLSEHSCVTRHLVERPLNSRALGAPLLAWRARRIAEKLYSKGGRVIVNGGNCAWSDVNWVHAVHATWDTRADEAPLLFRLRARCLKWADRRAERRALRRAALVITNSNRARRHLRDALELPEALVRTVYYGTNSELYRPASPDAKACGRFQLGLSGDKPIVAFVGALGFDRYKGFDVLFSAWETLCRDPSWDADLAVAGDGAELELWRRRAKSAGIEARIRLLGFTKDIPALMAASDALISPTHNDAYGLGIHEALACGLPALVTRSAGVAERYPDDLEDLLLSDPPASEDIVRKLRRWRADMAGAKARVAPFGALLRSRAWSDMGRDIEELILPLGEGGKMRQFAAG